VPTEHDYVEELAETINRMFGAGISDPSAREIAEAHFPEKALGGEITEGIRKRLHKIRDILEQDYLHPVCLVSRTYYSRFRREAPKTVADAARCLPIGYGKKQQGVYLQRGADDLIWEAMLQSNLASGAGKVKRSANRALDGVEGGRLSAQRAGELLSETRQHLAPDKPELAEQVIAALPADTDAE